MWPWRRRPDLTEVLAGRLTPAEGDLSEVLAQRIGILETERLMDFLVILDLEDPQQP